MALIKMILLINVLCLSGCAGGKDVHNGKREPMTMMDIYLNSTGQAQKDVTTFVQNNLKEENTFGYVKPYIPVVNDPEVRKVWIPDHKSQDNSDVMVAGHWVYVMVKPPTWFIEGRVIDPQVPIIVPSVENKNTQKVYNEDKKDYGY